MGYKLKKTIKVSKLSKDLALNWVGEDYIIKNIAPLCNSNTGSLTYSKNKLIGKKKAAIICYDTDLNPEDKNTYILSENPRLDFIRALYYLEKEVGFSIWKKKSYIHPTVIIGENVVIENGCYIGKNCV